MPTDREKVLAWMLETALKCKQCGTRKDEFDYDTNAYVAVADRCPGCERVSVEQEAHRDGGGSHHGLRFGLVKSDSSTTIPDSENRLSTFR